ncbi:MAG TPA: hypothetical protein VH186_09625 [Chloroflexia bacterium]|nr:hypothetical protein [Chloroflexia bacterium]
MPSQEKQKLTRVERIKLLAEVNSTSLQEQGQDETAHVDPNCEEEPYAGYEDGEDGLFSAIDLYNRQYDWEPEAGEAEEQADYFSLPYPQLAGEEFEAGKSEESDAHLIGANSTPQATDENTIPKETGSGSSDYSSRLDSSQNVPAKAIAKSGVIALPDGQFSAVVEVPGQDVRMMSPIEQYSFIKSFARYANTLTASLSLYASVEPGSVEGYVERLQRHSSQEKNPYMRMHYYSWIDWLREMQATSQPARRRFFVAIQSSPSDLIAGSASRKPGEEAGFAVSNSATDATLLSRQTRRDEFGSPSAPKNSDSAQSFSPVEKHEEDGEEEEEPGAFKRPTFLSTVYNRFQVALLGKDPALLQQDEEGQALLKLNENRPVRVSLPFSREQDRQVNSGFGQPGRKQGAHFDRDLPGVRDTRKKEEYFARNPDLIIPPGVEDNMAFRAQRLYETFNAVQASGSGGYGRPQSGPDIEALLAELFNSASRANPKMTARTHLQGKREVNPDNTPWPPGKSLEPGAGSKAKSHSSGAGFFNKKTWNGLYALDRIGQVRLKEFPDYLRLSSPLGKEYLATLYLTNYPTYSTPAMFADILSIKDVRFMAAFHFRPWSHRHATNQLRKRQSLNLAVKANDGSLTGDFERDYRIESLGSLRKVLARKQDRLFQVGVRLTVRASSLARLQSDLRKLSQRLEEMGFEVATATRNQRRAFYSTLPIGYDPLGREQFLADRTLHPNMTSANVACLMPNVLPNFTDSRGIILGRNNADGSLITYHRWQRERANPHSLFVATTGAGKSFSMISEAAQEMMLDNQLEVFMIDPQGRDSAVVKFAHLVGGTEIDMAGRSILNCMDRYRYDGRADSYGERIDYLRPLFELMTRSVLTAYDRNAIGWAVKRLYHHFEDGESCLAVLARNFASRPAYEPLRPFLFDNPLTREAGIMTRLSRIYAELREKYRIPPNGWVAGYDREKLRARAGQGQNSALKLAPGVNRPICHLEEGRWVYRGEGMLSTGEAFTDEADRVTGENSGHQTGANQANGGEGAEVGGKAAGQGAAVPSPVWYPAREWREALAKEFRKRVLEESLFSPLDKTAREPAIRDAFVELKAGMPILADLLPFLAAEGAGGLAANLEQFVDPEIYGPLFNGFTNIRLIGQSRFICFNVRDLPEDLLRPIRMFEIVSYTWNIVRSLRKRRMFICDEFGLLSQAAPDVCSYMRQLFQRGRFFGLAMTIIVQNITNILDNREALQCAENCGRRILMRQTKEAINRLMDYYDLTLSQAELLLSAHPGVSLQLIADRKIPVTYLMPEQYRVELNTNVPSPSGYESDDEPDGQANSNPAGDYFRAS